METKKVYAAINAVQRELVKTGIAKGQVNGYDKYRFRGIDDVYNALGPAIAKAGLVILPRVVSHEAAEKPTQKGGVQNQVKVAVEYDFVSAEDGSMHTVVGIGEGLDRSDKATPKAMAAAFKYAAFQAFCIPTEGSVDADAESPQLAPQPTAVPAPAADPLIAETQAAWIKKELENQKADVKKFCEHFGVVAVDDLKASQLPAVKKAINTKRQQVATAAAQLNNQLQ